MGKRISETDGMRTMDCFPLQGSSIEPADLEANKAGKKSVRIPGKGKRSAAAEIELFVLKILILICS